MERTFSLKPKHLALEITHRETGRAITIHIGTKEDKHLHEWLASLNQLSFEQAELFFEEYHKTNYSKIQTKNK